MQNKPNFKETVMDVTAVKRRYYEKRTLGGFGKTNPKQTQSNPKQSQFKAKTNPNKPNSRFTNLDWCLSLGNDVLLFRSFAA
jgi:hypothetical protein